MIDIIQLAINGVAVGSIYALAALGFILVYNATGVVNFAAGHFVMIGAFFGILTILQLDLNSWLSYPLAIALSAGFGGLFFLLVHFPLRHRSALSIIIGTVMMGIAIQNAALLFWGPWPYQLPSLFGDGVFNLYGATVSVHAVATIFITIALIVVLYAVLQLLPVGRSMRAVAQDPQTARLIGLPVAKLLAFSWIMAAILAGFAGLLVAPMWFADASMAESIGLKAFAATIIGGFGSLPGAILGGVLVGLIEVMGAAYISTSFKDLFAFVVMIIFLIVRPQGIFGEPISDRG